MSLALACLCGGVFIVALAACVHGYERLSAWWDRYQTMKRDLKVTQRLLAERTLELAMLRVSMNLRSTMLSVRKRPRGLYIVGSPK